MTYTQGQAQKPLTSTAPQSNPTRGIAVKSNALRAQRAYGMTEKQPAAAPSEIPPLAPSPVQAPTQIAAQIDREQFDPDCEEYAGPKITPELRQLAGRYVDIFKGPLEPNERDRVIEEVALFYSTPDRVKRLEALVDSF